MNVTVYSRGHFLPLTLTGRWQIVEKNGAQLLYLEREWFTEYADSTLSSEREEWRWWPIPRKQVTLEYLSKIQERRHVEFISELDIEIVITNDVQCCTNNKEI